MPTLWTRVREIVSASSHASLDAMENPAVMSQQLMREIDDDLQGIRTHLLAALGRLRQIETSQHKLRQTADAHGRRARSALQQQRQDEARHQLALQLQLRAEIDSLGELADGQQQWIASLKRERATLLREREELGAQARVIQLRHGLQADTPRHGADPYTRAMQRRERMRGYTERVEAGLHGLRAAQQLRQEELDGELGTGEIDPSELDAALAALSKDIESERSA